MNDMLTVKQIADRLGVSLGTAYALIASGQLQHYRVRTKKATRGTIRVTEGQLNAYLSMTAFGGEGLVRPTVGGLKLKHLHLD